jgi:hypothetical protein
MLADCAALLSLLLAGAGWSLDSFEEDTPGWGSVGGRVSYSGEHWKLGKRSLRWDFSPGATLTRAKDASLEEALNSREGGIKLWLYCEQPLLGALQCQVGPWAFPVNLGFTGWRAVWVLFRDDAQQATPIEGLQITAPNATGTIFIDALELGPVPWFRQGDAQAPYTNPGRTHGKYWFTVQDWAEIAPPAPPAQLSTEDINAFREITRRYERWMFGRLDDPREPVRTRLEAVKGEISWGHKAFDQLRLDAALVSAGDWSTTPGYSSPTARRPS